MPADGPLWRDNLAVRDYLRTHDDDAQRYSRKKLEAARAHHAPQAYQDAKRDFVDDLRRTVRRWADRGRVR